MDDFLILLQAKLDEAKSKGNVNADISKIQNQLDKLKLQAEIDPKTVSDLVSQLESILNQKITISNIGIDRSQSVRAAQKTGQQIGEAINQGITSTVKKTNNTLKSFTDLKSFSELNKSINNFHVDTSELKNYKSILDEVKNTYSEFGQVRITNEIFKDGVLEKFKVNIEQVNGDLKETKSFIMALNDEKDAFVFSGLISGSESVVQHLDKTKNAVNQTAEAINALKEKAQIDKIQLSIGENGNISTQIKTLTDNFSKLGLSADDVKAKMKSVDAELTVLKTLLNSGASNSTIVSQFDKLQLILNETQNDLKATRSEYSLLVSAQQRLAKSNIIEAWNQKNSKASKEVKSTNEAYIASLRDLNSQMTKMQFNDIVNGFKQSEISMRGLNKLGISLKEQFSQAAKSLTQWLSVSSGVMALFYQLKRMPKVVYEIDTAMTNLYKVTDETEKKYVQFLDSASESAFNLGRSVSSLVEQTANWAKLGFSLDEASKLAEISSVYANVGEVDNDTAVSDMVTSMKAFNIEAADAITIVDKLNKLGNEYATSAAALGDGLSRSASAMSTAGTDINKTLAMLTGGTEITQNASEFGNFLKIGSMRIRGMKGDLEELGEEVDETVDSISKVQTQILNRTGGKVNIFDDLGNFRDYYDIMKDISEVYNELSDPDKADLTEILFGKQRGNQGAALIQAFQSGQIQKALEATLNAEGSAMQEQERWMDSLEAKTQQFEASFQSLSSTVFDSDLLKWFVDLGTTGVNSLDSLISKFGTLGTISTIGGGFLGAKNRG